MDILDGYFANVFYHTGIPFRFADSPSLKEFLKRLRPDYSPPSAKKVAGSLLNNAHLKFKENLKVLIHPTKCCFNL